MSNLELPRPDPRSVLGTAVQSLECYAIALFAGFESAAHHRLIIDKLEAVERGDIRRLMIFEPPRHGKSLLASQLFPAWYLGRHPDRSVICATYRQDLSDDFGRKVRNLLIDPLHQAIFPASRLSNDSASQRRFDLTGGGSYAAAGRGGPITGRGAHLLVLDDVIKDREESMSETVRRNLHEWYQSVAYTRLTPDGAVVLCQTCWHQDDLAGFLLREHPEENWTVLSLPAIAEVNDALGRAEGAALWPERFPLPVLEQIRAAIGSTSWVSLYQQRPAAAEGTIFKRDQLRFYDREPEHFKRLIVSADTAFKVGSSNDYSVLQLWGEAQNGFYLLVNLRARVEYPELKRMVVSLDGERRPHAVLVEDAASGQSLLQELRASTSLPLKAIKPDRDKVSRATAVSPLFEAGRVFLPQTAPWLADFIDELCTFPSAVHDDQVDAAVMALTHLRGSGTANIAQFWANQVARNNQKKFGQPNLPQPAVCPKNPADGQHAFTNGICTFCGKSR